MATAVNTSEIYSVENETKRLVNNQRLSDVAFVVGENKDIIYAHKIFLSMGSPVFEDMFFSDNDRKREDTTSIINIKDLTNWSFVNMIMYIYGHKIDEFQLSEMYETYLACERYQVKGFNYSLFECLERMLNLTNCLFIYDLVLKIPNNESSCLLRVKKLIQENCETLLESDAFLDIGQETLQNLLTMKVLPVNEIFLLKASAKWVNAQLLKLELEANAENKRKIFQPIKEFIKFSDIPSRDYTGFDEIEQLLSNDELASLFLYSIVGSKPLSIGCKTNRLMGISNYINYIDVACKTNNIGGLHDSVSDCKTNKDNKESEVEVTVCKTNGHAEINTDEVSDCKTNENNGEFDFLSYNEICSERILHHTCSFKHGLCIKLRVNRKLFIRAIHTTITSENVVLRITKTAREGMLDFKMKMIDNRMCVGFNNDFEVEPDVDYELYFHNGSKKGKKYPVMLGETYTDTELKTNKIVFTLNFSSTHCIKMLSFIS